MEEQLHPLDHLEPVVEQEQVRHMTNSLSRRLKHCHKCLGGRLKQIQIVGETNSINKKFRFYHDNIN